MIVDWVEWQLSGGLLVHTPCGQRTVSVRDSYGTSWGVPSLWCSTCRADISRFEVPEFKWGEKYPVQLDSEVARLEEMITYEPAPV